MNNTLTMLCALGACLMLSGCGGGESASESTGDASQPITVPEPEGAPLRYATDGETILNLLRNGLRMPSTTSQPGLSATTGSIATGVYSQTTTQVSGVDEADPVKYDGEYIYSLHSVPVYSLPTPTNPSAPSLTIALPGFQTTLRIARTDSATAFVEPIAQAALDGTSIMQPEMYLLDELQHLAVLTQREQRFSSGPSIQVVQSNRIGVELWDVRDPAQPDAAWRIELDGWMRASRRVGDTLFIAAQYSPLLPGLRIAASTTQDRTHNENLIRAAGVNDLLPQYRIDGGASQTLLQPTGCLLPANLTPQHAYRELLVLTAIDLRQRRVTDVECLSVADNGVYMSPDSLYVGGDAAQKTALHKFAILNGRFEYRAGGEVDGVLGWNNSSYFMDEHNGDLRIVTTRYASNSSGGVVFNDFTHHLAILRQDGGRLVLRATLPNATRPEPIGKPREHIRAVRFDGDRAFIVTFLQVDPLYVVDLQNHDAPFIAGELEVPGFSTYLRPLGRDYLLGVGQHADTNGVVRGTKVELYDIRDIAQPRSVAEHVFERSWSNALLDFHGLTFLTLPGANTRYRLALPMDVYTLSTTQLSRWGYSGLHLFEVDGLQHSNPQLRFQGVLRAGEDDNGSWFAYPNRGVLHDDSVFYVYGDEIESSLWQALPPQ